MRIFLLFLLLLAPFFGSGCSKKSSEEVVIYVSEDRIFSEPVLKVFEQKTGIKVHALYDTEESKSTGLLNRLIAERNNPQADLYWANEPIRAEILKQKGLLEPSNPKNAEEIPEKFSDKDKMWHGFSARLRLLIVSNTAKKEPRSIFDYTNANFKNKAVIANPLFGSTTAEIGALFVLLGDAKAKAFLKELKQNGTKIATSNGESADLVAKGLYDFALVDSDDAISRLRAKKPVHIVYPDQAQEDIGIFVIPNAVMLIKGAKHKQNATKLMEFLLSKESEALLAKADCAQIPLHSGATPPKELPRIESLKTMQIDYAKVAQKIVQIQDILKQWAKE